MLFIGRSTTKHKIKILLLCWNQ